MKKKLEADLISIAHRILKLKNKSDLLQLHQETQKLYEKLSILKFVEENFGEVKPTIGLEALESKLESAFADADEAIQKMPESETAEDFGEAADEVSEPEVEATEAAIEETEGQEAGDQKAGDQEADDQEADDQEADDQKADDQKADDQEAEGQEADDQAIEDQEAEAEKASENEPEAEEEIPAAEDAGVSTDAADFTPSFELAFDKKDPEPATTRQTSFEDLMSHGYEEPVFVKAGEAEAIKVNDHEEIKEEPKQETPIWEPEPEVREAPKEAITEKTEDGLSPFDLPLSEVKMPHNEALGKSITIGLNDRIGFEKQLFGGSSEDLNRVLSQLNTFDTFDEAREFIEDMVKPDYNNWEGKDDYAQRFMEIVEKKFA